MSSAHASAAMIDHCRASAILPRHGNTAGSAHIIHHSNTRIVCLCRLARNRLSTLLMTRSHVSTHIATIKRSGIAASIIAVFPLVSHSENILTFHKTLVYIPTISKIYDQEIPGKIIAILHSTHAKKYHSDHVQSDQSDQTVILRPNSHHKSI